MVVDEPPTKGIARNDTRGKGNEMKLVVFAISVPYTSDRLRGSADDDQPLAYPR
jgi:hypothetical protein